MENIQSQVSEVKQSKNHPSVKLAVKLTFWHVVLLFLSLYHWRYVDYILNTITSESIRFDIEPAALLNFIVLIAWIGLGMALFSSRWWVLTMIGAVVSPFFLFFGFDWPSLIGLGAAVGLFFDSEANIREEIKNRIKFKARIVIRRGLVQIILALSLLMSFAAYQSPAVQSFQTVSELPSATGTFIRGIVSATVRSFSKIEDPALRESIEREVTDQTTATLNRFLEPYFRYAPPILAFSVFLVLWGLSWIFVILSMLLGMLLFWVLKRFGFVEIQEYDVKAQKLMV